LALPLDPATREALEGRLRFYRDLGLTEFYRRPVDPELAQQIAALEANFQVATPAAPTPPPPAQRAAVQGPQPPAAKPLSNASPFALTGSALQGLVSPPPSPVPQTQPDAQPGFYEDQPIPPRAPFPIPPKIAAATPPDQRAAALQQIRDEIGDCTRCALHAGRNKLVFGDGDPNARLMFVGEGPGADEDMQGLPFVGKAGQLLNNMIAAMGLTREQVYIANVVKCRPPANRVPEPEEGATCTPFLFRQIDVVRPEVLVALGATAATWLLGARQPLAGLRGRIHNVRGAKLIVTYHPAFLLRDPRQKKEAWADLQIAMRELGLKPPVRG
jgi:DNA polymerase